MNAETRRFSFWLIFQDMRMWPMNEGHYAKKTLVEFFEGYLGPVGGRWQFDARDPKRIIVKADKDLDVTLLLLKFQRQ